MYNQRRNYRKEYHPNSKFPKEDDQYYYFYFCKNESDDYMDLQQRIAPFAEIIPVPNFYPYDATINVQIKITKSSAAAEWIQYVLPYKAKAMASIMGIPIHTFACYLIEYSPYWYAATKNRDTIAAMEASVDELIKYFGQTKMELYESILQYYGSDFVWQEFCYTQEQYKKYKSVWDRPAMLPREPNPSYDAWYNVTWKSEMRLFNLVRAYYPDAQFHYTANWLGNQHLDIYSEAGNVAFEYQGEQHYKSIDYFGGQCGLYQRMNLDEKKRWCCENNNVTLIEWEYTVPIFPVYLLKKLREKNVFWKIYPSITRKVLWEDMTPILFSSKSMRRKESEPKKKKQTLILRVSKEGEIEKEYCSVKEAAEDTKLSKKGIEKVIYGERKSCGGYIWVKCTKDEYENLD